MTNKKLFIKMIIPWLILSTIFISFGCSSWTASLIEATKILDQAKERMRTEQSFRMDGMANIQLKTKAKTQSIQLHYHLLYEKRDNGESIAQMNISTELQKNQMNFFWGSTGKEVEIEGYIVGNRIYIKMPGSGRWVCKEADTPTLYNSFNQMLMPEEVEKLLDSAQKVEVLENSEDYIKYFLSIDPEKLLTTEELERLRENFSRRGLPEELWDKTVEMAKDMFSHARLTITVDKESGLLTYIQMEIDDIKVGEALPLPEKNGIISGASASIFFEFNISDYGKAFNLELPEEAKNAVPGENILDNLEV